jgi:2-methylcitrate dehydratase
MALCQQISTIGSPAEMVLGARATITMKSGAVITDELAAPDAHPSGARPFQRSDYIAKFTELAEGVIDRREQQRFLDVVTCLSDLKRGMLGMLNPVISQHILDEAPITHGIFP